MPVHVPNLRDIGGVATPEGRRVRSGLLLRSALPAADDLVLFSEDDVRFYYGDRSIDKDLIAAVRVLINGAPIAAAVATRYAKEAALHPTSFEERPEGIAPLSTASIFVKSLAFGPRPYT